MCVTKSTMPTHEYSLKNQQIRVDYSQFNQRPVVVLAAISQQMGVDHIQLFDRAVDIKKFKTFIEELRAKYWADDIAVYLDNLSVHTSKAVKERLEEMSIPYIFSPIYSPDFNGIETVFSIAKGYIKKQRLRAIILEEQIDLKKLTREAFDRINVLKISNCI